MADGSGASSSATTRNLGDLSANFDRAAVDIMPEEFHDLEISQNAVVSRSSSDADSAGVNAKACLVCGDRAQGHNFGIIACGSCKAFFRRNALKSKIVPCLFSGSCSVTSATRSFCPACRLGKCLAAGMKTELIMSQEAKSQRKEMILKNKKRKVEQGRPSSVPPRDGCEIDADCSSQLSRRKSGGDSSSSSSNASNSANGTSCHEQSPAFQRAAGEDWIGELDLRPVKADRQIRGLSTDTAAAGIDTAPPLGDGISLEVVVSGRFAAVLQRVQTALAATALCVQRRLASGDDAQLSSLTCAYQSTIGLDPSVDAPEPAEGFSMQLFATRMSNVIRRMVLFAKETPRFASLPRPTQIRLLRGGATPCLLIRSAELLDLPSGCWKDAGSDRSMSLDDLKRVSGDSMPDYFFIEHLALSASVKQLVPVDASGQCDRTVFALLLMIALLSPDYLSTVSELSDEDGSSCDPAIVSDAQQHYATLLRRHLEVVYSFQLCSKALPALLQQIAVLKRYSRRQNRGFMSCALVRSDPLCQEVLGP